MRKGLFRYVLISISLVASHTVAQPTGDPTTRPNAATQEESAVMERLLQWQQGRDGSAPADAPPTVRSDSGRQWEEKGPHSQAAVARRRALHIADAMSTIRATAPYKAKDPRAQKNYDEANALLATLRECSLEQYRDITLACWAENDAEEAKQWRQWEARDGFGSVMASVRSALQNDRSMRGVRMAESGPVRDNQDDGSRTMICKGTFDFVTQSGLVRSYDGWVAVIAKPGEGISVVANIDGSQAHPFDQRTVARLPWPFDCSWAEIRTENRRLVLTRKGSGRKPDRLYP